MILLGSSHLLLKLTDPHSLIKVWGESNELILKGSLYFSYGLGREQCIDTKELLTFQIMFEERAMK